MWLPTEYVGATSCGALLLIPLGGKAKMTGGYLEKKWIGIKKIIWKAFHSVLLKS